jgi:hypothetical protein
VGTTIMPNWDQENKKYTFSSLFEKRRSLKQDFRKITRPHEKFRCHRNVGHRI